MSSYEIVKDADVSIGETITGLAIDSGASISWMLFLRGQDFSGDLDALAGSGGDALIEKITDSGGGVIITDGPSGKFTVTLDPEDTEELTPGKQYQVLIRKRSP